MSTTPGNDWIEHDGAGMPPAVNPHSFPTVRFRCGLECAELEASERLWRWRGIPELYDIVAYRLDARDAQRQRRARTIAQRPPAPSNSAESSAAA